MSAKKKVGCSYCGAAKGEACKVTLSDRPDPLSIPWQHRAREVAQAR